MKKKTFVTIVALLLLVLFTACSKGITQKDLEALSFEDVTVEYDGEVHKILIDNIYEEQGVTITYLNNNNSKPGTYTVTANITYNDIMVTKSAKLKINKIASDLVCETEQYVYLYGGDVLPKYTLGNTSQTVYMLNEDKTQLNTDNLYKVGTYKIEIYAAATSLYEESTHYNVNLHVIDSKYNLCLKDQTYTYDGSEKTLTLTGEIPSGYTVEYTNNTASEVGTYYAYAYLKDASGKVCEVHAATLKIVNSDNAEFSKYLDEFFVEYLEGDQLSVNIFCEHPEDFGLEHYDAKWYTYESITDSEIKESVDYFNELLEELHGFDMEKLSDLQLVAYRNIESFINYYLDLYSIDDSSFMRITYVDQFGGYVADFGTYMEAYSLRGEQEVIDVINYLQSTKEAFPSYLTFISEKASKGYALSDYTINEMRKYLKDIIDEGNDYYLKGILTEKINKVDFLTDEEKKMYVSQVESAVSDAFIPGVEALYDGLDDYLGLLSEDETGYWAVYDKGKDMYVLALEDLLGISDLDMMEYISTLDTAMTTANEKALAAQKMILNLYKVGSWDEFMRVINNNPIYKGTPDEMMVYLKEFAKTIVPELKTSPEITIKEMDAASAKVSNAVAYYMKSALDNTQGEYITLNPEKLNENDLNDVIGTLSHEGYPGHLYAYVYSKELGLSNLSTIMTNTAHGEGWATYVELKLYEYARSLSSDSGFKFVMDYLYANQLSGFLLETRLDAGIHYQGWTVSDVAKYMDKLGYNSDSAQDIYNLLIEMPTNYAAYGYGKLTFYNLHQEAKSILGGFYDEVEFNAMILSKGWTGLEELQNTYDEYMKSKMHQYGLN